jgi:hypothetical protein
MIDPEIDEDVRALLTIINDLKLELDLMRINLNEIKAKAYDHEHAPKAD